MIAGQFPCAPTADTTLVLMWKIQRAGAARSTAQPPPATASILALVRLRRRREFARNGRLEESPTRIAPARQPPHLVLHRRLARRRRLLGRRLRLRQLGAELLDRARLAGGGAAVGPRRGDGLEGCNLVVQGADLAVVVVKGGGLRWAKGGARWGGASLPGQRCARAGC
jgi:hypothetical protein